MPTDTPPTQFKTIQVSPNSRLNEDIARCFDDMMAFASPREYRDTLVEIYNMYVLHEYKNLPEEFFDMASRMMVMLDFLKSCE